MKELQVSFNQRFLQYADGQPFFWLGDTAWELFHRLNKEEVQQYLSDRSAKGFNIIQAVVCSELDGLRTPNAYGQRPFHECDPERPNEAYFEHVDFIITTANALGLYVAVLPCWGSYAGELFDESKAYGYGKFLGNRYKANGVVWVLGGDRPGDGAMHVWNAMAEGLRCGDEGRHLITYHPNGEHSSAEWFHQADWLDFNMVQSGHGRKANSSYFFIERDYERKPAKPVIDAEPLYEDLPIDFQPINGRFDDYDCRIAAYWSVFSGACGHTYGANSVWQMWDVGRTPMVDANRSWSKSLQLPGSFQMRHLKALMESRPYFSRIPDQSIVYEADNVFDHGTNYQLATRDGTLGHADATYLMIYRPTITWKEIHTTAIAGDKLRMWWYDPCTGIAYPSPVFENPRGKFFGLEEWKPWKTPTQQKDWIIVIDDADKGYPSPGVRL